MAKGDAGGQQGGGYFPGMYQAAVGQTGEDYDNIMNQYKQFVQKSGYDQNNSNHKLNFSPISPTLATYQTGNDHKDLRDIAATGGYSEGDISNIRSRATSPIKSIYDSAQRGLDRSKSLQGGYSPNLGASSAKMARESAGLASQASTNANAGIAEMIQKGKLSASTALAPLDARQNEFQNNFNQHNAGVTNAANMFNAQMPLNYAQHNSQQSNNNFDHILQGIQGQQSLYGTTPGLANTFGNQALNAANIVGGFPPINRGSSGFGGRSGIPQGARVSQRGGYSNYGQPRKY